jgi:hypothetical protein
MMIVKQLRQVEPPPSLQPHPLAEAFEEQDTVILLVVGSGADSDRNEERCRGLALDPGFESVRVVRVRDRSELSGPKWSYFLGGNRPLAVIGPGRRTALPLERPDAIDLFVAVSAAA